MFLRELVAALSDASVRYAIVGGVAMNLHGVPRMTYDVDLVVTPSSYEALERVLLSLGLRPRLPLLLRELVDVEHRRALKQARNLVAMTFTDPNRPLRETDLRVDPDIDAEGIVARAQPRPLGRETLRVCSRADLVALKRHAGRDKDLHDLADLGEPT
jgi:hypothetical protein